MKIIENNLENATTIIIDMWKGYNFFQNSDFDHFKINHGNKFVDPENPIIYTQNIENLWR